MKNKSIKKIAYLTGTRADFGLMTPILKAIDRSKKLELKLYATGSHLMPQFGKTINQVRKEFPRVKILQATFTNDQRAAINNFMADLLKSLTVALTKDRPDLVLTLGDRPEMLVASAACLYLGIPTGHIHGGERSATVDEITRHTITKLSQLHFPATRESADRIEKLGEASWRIKVIGAPAGDVILKEKLFSRDKLLKTLGIKKTNRLILVTLHPISENVSQSGRQMKIVIEAAKSFNCPVVIIYPNTDPGGQAMIKVIESHRGKENFYISKNLNHRQFLSLEREAAVWVGNSSAGLIESAFFKTPVVNVGPRQLNRERSNNIIDVDYNLTEIKRAIQKSLNDKVYLNKIKKSANPWGNGFAGPRLAKLLESMVIDSKLLNKRITY